MTAKKRLDSVGWGFFGLTLLVYVPLLGYLMYRGTYDTLHIGTRIGTGVFFGFIAAGFTSWLVNSMLFYRAQRLEAKEPPPPAQEKKTPAPEKKKPAQGKKKKKKK